MLDMNERKAKGVDARCRKCGAPFTKYEWSLCNPCMSEIFKDIEQRTKQASQMRDIKGSVHFDRK